MVCSYEIGGAEVTIQSNDVAVECVEEVDDDDDSLQPVSVPSARRTWTARRSWWRGQRSSWRSRTVALGGVHGGNAGHVRRSSERAR
jgi:hypothetical protein